MTAYCFYYLTHPTYHIIPYHKCLGQLELQKSTKRKLNPLCGLCLHVSDSTNTFPIFMFGFMAILLIIISTSTSIVSPSSLSLCSHSAFFPSCCAVNARSPEFISHTVSSIVGSHLIDCPRKLWTTTESHRSNLSRQSPRVMLQEVVASVHTPNNVRSDWQKTDSC